MYNLLNSDELVDYRLYSQYKEMPKLKSFVALIPNVLDQGGSDNEHSELDGIRNCYNDMTYNIEDAFGKQLDVIGRIVGFNRPIVYDSEFFGYDTVPNATGYTDLELLEIKATYWKVSAGDIQYLDDKTYRNGIYAKILANNSNTSIQSLEVVLTTLLGQQAWLVENTLTSGVVELEIVTTPTLTVEVNSLFIAFFNNIPVKVAQDLRQTITII